MLANHTATVKHMPATVGILRRMGIVYDNIAIDLGVVKTITITTIVRATAASPAHIAHTAGTPIITVVRFDATQ